MTRALQRGASRCLSGLGYGVLTEVPLPNGQRADVMGLSAAGEILIVEIKSCLADFRMDRKWQGYREYCDRLCFAVAPDFPEIALPEDVGLIVADGFGGEFLRQAPLTALSSARRKAMTIAFARLGAHRLMLNADPFARTGLETC